MNRKQAGALGVVVASAAALLLAPAGQDILVPLFCNPASQVSQHLTDVGFEEGDFIVNPSPDQIPEGSEAYTRGGGSFNESGVYTTDQLFEFMNSNTPNAALLRSVVEERLAGRTVDWTWVYFPSAVNIEGNLGVENGEVVDFGTRESGAGELVAFPVDRANCQVVQGLVIRAGCSNPGFRVVPPCKEGEDCTPPPPPEMCPWDPSLPIDHPKCLAPKVEELGTDPAPGTEPDGPGEPEAVRPGLPTSPAPILPSTPAPTSTSPAPGSTPVPTLTPMPTITNTPAPGGGTCVPIPDLGITCPAAP